MEHIALLRSTRDDSRLRTRGFAYGGYAFSGGAQL